MKKLIVSVVLFSATLSFAQQKQVKQAYLALESNDIATVNSKIQEADAILGNKIYLLEPELQEKYYLAKGVALLNKGNSEDGAKMLVKINELNNAKIYRGKNANKQKVYYVGKEAANASGISKLKAKTYKSEMGTKVKELVGPILNNLSSKTIEAYNNKDYSKAGDGFKNVYYLLKVIGQDDPQYLYNAAISYAYAKRNTDAINVFNSLIDRSYDGVVTTYTAKDKTTGKEVNVEKSTWDALKKNPQYSDFKSSTSKSIEEDLYDTVITLLINDERYDEAERLVNKGLKKLPNSSKLLNQQGIVYARLGKTDAFISTLKKQVQSNPNDAIAWFNLGVLYGKDNKHEEAIASYKRAIEVDPTMKNAYLNLAYQYIGDDSKTISEYNKIVNKKGGKVKAEKILNERRARFEKALPYAEKLFELDRSSQNAGLLKNIYRATKNKAKYKEFQDLEANLSK